MTKRLSTIAPLDALYASAREYPGGIRALAEVRDVTVDTMYQKLDPGNPKNHINFDDELFSLLDQLRAAGVASWPRMLEALCEQYGGVFVRLPEAAQGGDQVRATMMVAALREFGEFMAEVTSDAVAGVDDRAMERITKEGGDAHRAIQQIMSWAGDEHQRWRSARSLRSVA